MLLTHLLLALTTSPAPATMPVTMPAALPSTGDSLLAAVPGDAYAIVHCRDAAALRARAERNDWYRLLGSPHGEPLLTGLAHDFRYRTHSDMDELLAMARNLDGEVVGFDTGTVGGVVVEPPADRATLVGLMRAWVPAGDSAARRTFELAGATVELVAWPDEIDGWTGRAGHFAALVDHPQALAIYSGDDSAAVMAALTGGLEALGTDRRAPIVASYLEQGGGASGGIEFFVDFTPFAGRADAALARAAEGLLPDPSRLLGLEQGTWLHASADIFPGTEIDCRARLHVPADTLAARLADTFEPLPHTLPADLPGGVWSLWALNWDLAAFYQRARAAYEEAGHGEGLAMVDAGIEAARAAADVDPIVDVIGQLAGNFAFYFIEPAEEPRVDDPREMDELLSLGFHAGLVDGDAFLTAFEKLLGLGGMDSEFELTEIAGADVYLVPETEADSGFDGGMAFLPHSLTVSPARRVLERSLGALTRADGASLLDGSRMQAVIDENAGACFLTCVEMTPLRAFLLPELEDDDLRLPPLDDGQVGRDPFDSQLVSSVRRTPQGFDWRLHTR